MEAKIDRRSLIEALRLASIERVVVEYSGGGDNGSVDSINAYKAGDEQIKDVDALYRDAEQGIIMRVSNALLGKQDVAMTNTLENFAYEMLDEAGVPDWCNNDGGSGTLTIDLTKDVDGEEGVGTIHIEHTMYYTESRYEEYIL